MDNPLEEFSFSDPFSTWWPFIFAALVGVVTTIRSYISGPSCPSNTEVQGKLIVITGGSRGIGAEVVVELIKRGAKVIVGTRNTKECLDNLEKRIPQEKSGNLQALYLDLTKLKSVQSFARSIREKKIDVLINNAGIAFHDWMKTEDNLEMHLAVNYVGHFLLIHNLFPKLEAADHARVINTSAHVHFKGKLDLMDLNCEKNYSASRAFANSKLTLLLMSRYLANCWQGSSVTINSVNPGIVRGTGHTSKSLVSRSFAFKLMAGPTAWLLTKTPSQAAQTIIYLVVADELQNTSGRYFSNCSEISTSEEAMDAELARKLYKKTLALTKQYIIGNTTHEQAKSE